MRLLPQNRKQTDRPKRPLAFAAIAAVSWLEISAPAGWAMNDGGGNATPNRYASIETVYWNGVQITAWKSLNGGVHAYKVTYPPGYTGRVTLSEGWHFCANQADGPQSLNECIGQPPAK
jgi:hypothetical protein